MKPYKFNPIKELDVSIPRNRRQEALAEVADYVKEALLDYIGDGKSPVSGGKWVKGLTKDYAKKKADESGSGFANLELTGDLLDSLSVDVSSNKIVIDVGSDQYGKAEGHLTGIYGDHSKRVRPRQFIPQSGETLKRDIVAGIKDILRQYEDGND